MICKPIFRKAYAFLMVPMLTACAGSGALSPSVRLAEIPADLRSCFRKTVAPPPATGDLTRAQVAGLLAELKRSERAMSVCGQRIIAWFDAQAETLAGH